VSPAPKETWELAPELGYCQRWDGRRHSWRHKHEGGFNARHYAVDMVPESVAKTYVTTNHYSASYPAAKFRYGLFDATGALVGVSVFGIPMQAAVLTNTFQDLEAMVESVELSRFVLADAVPANAESWFLARCFEELVPKGVRGVNAFSDPVPRQVGGELLFPGHVGTIYQASNSRYCGRATARTLTVLPDGRVLSDRSAQKVRSQDRGHEHVEKMLIALGANTPRAGCRGATWLTEALNDVGATRIRHRGNRRYAFALGTRSQRRRLHIIGGPSPYPKQVDESSENVKTSSTEE